MPGPLLIHKGHYYAPHTLTKSTMTTSNSTSTLRSKSEQLLQQAGEGLQGLKDAAFQQAENAEQMVRGLTHEAESEAHQIFRNFPGHADKTKVTRGHVVPGIEHPGSTGVM